MPEIIVDSVRRSYGDLVAVDDLSFDVNAGEVVGLLGPNGAGKTTTLRMLATLLQPDAGTLSVAGHDTVTAPLDVRAKLGYHTGDTGLYQRLKPLELLRFFADMHSMPRATRDARVQALADMFDLHGFTEQRCATLSTGQQQRVSLARALVHDPPVVILDEPTSGLDIVSSQVILNTMRRAAADGRAVLFSTHIMSDVELVCDRVIIMHRGAMLAQGTVADLLEQTGTDQLSRAFLALIGAQEPDLLQPLEKTS